MLTGLLFISFLRVQHIAQHSKDGRRGEDPGGSWVGSGGLSTGLSSCWQGEVGPTTAGGW